MDSTGYVTLEAFAARVGCHFTTASRLRAGERMPGRKLLGRIVEEYRLDPKESLRIFTEGTPDEFGEFLKKNVFSESDEVEAGPRETGASKHDHSTGTNAA